MKKIIILIIIGLLMAANSRDVVITGTGTNKEEAVVIDKKWENRGIKEI